MATAAGVLGVIQLITTLEPAAFNLIASLARGLAGKSDAEVLAADAGDWAQIVATAHATQQGTPSKSS
jgi:hypothetical protein